MLNVQHSLIHHAHMLYVCVRGFVRVRVRVYVCAVGLTKDPKEYTDKNQPHANVALQMLKEGKIARSGDFIGYVICVGEGPVAQVLTYIHTMHSHIFFVHTTDNSLHVCYD